jgi:hypothetical protein
LEKFEIEEQQELENPIPTEPLPVNNFCDYYITTLFKMIYFIQTPLLEQADKSLYR